MDFPAYNRAQDTSYRKPQAKIRFAFSHVERNNCVQFTTFYMQRFTTVLRKMQTSIFLLIVIVMDSIKSNVSVNFVEGIQ